ncbi:MAG: hypothetical protein D6718_12500, partial [Acidobacteria bacterium]
MPGLVVILNRAAGTAAGRARELEALLRARGDGSRVVITSDPEEGRRAAAAAARGRPAAVVAAGGDGT